MVTSAVIGRMALKVLVENMSHCCGDCDPGGHSGDGCGGSIGNMVLLSFSL